MPLENVSVERDLVDCCVVFGDKLDSNQTLKDPFFTRGRHNDINLPK